ncbi:MAG: hypothetical protein AB7F65_04940 [Dehalococcoidia bacterium]
MRRVLRSVFLGVSLAVVVLAGAGCLGRWVWSEDDASPTPAPARSATPQAPATVDGAPSSSATPMPTSEEGELRLPGVWGAYLKLASRALGYDEPRQVLSAALPELTVTSTEALFDGDRLEVVFEMASAPTGEFTSVDYWVSVVLPGQPTAPLIVNGGTDSEGDWSVARILLANGGVMDHPNVYERRDAERHRVTVRIPSNWGAPEQVTVWAVGYMDDSLLELVSGAPVEEAVVRAPVPPTTSGLPEPPLVAPMTSLPRDLESMWQGGIVTWEQEGLRVSLRAPDNWLAQGDPDSFDLWYPLEIVGQTHDVYFGVRRLEAGGRTAEEIIDAVIAASDGAYEVYWREAGQTAYPYQASAGVNSREEFRVLPGATDVMPLGWTSGAGWQAIWGAHVFPEGEAYVVYLETSSLLAMEQVYQYVFRYVLIER